MAGDQSGRIMMTESEFSPAIGIENICEDIY